MARPDRELRHEPGRCGWCGAGLAGRPVTGVERRQVFDLPEAAVAVTEHQLIERECGCGQRTRAAAPPKHGIGFFDALVMLTKCEPWMPAST